MWDEEFVFGIARLHLHPFVCPPLLICADPWVSGLEIAGLIHAFNAVRCQRAGVGGMLGRNSSLPEVAQRSRGSSIPGCCL